MAITGPMETKLQTYLRVMSKNGGSDLHMKSTAIPRIRVHGTLKALGKDTWDATMVENLAKEILTPDQYSKLVQDLQLDFSYVIGTEGRFRANLFYQMNGLSLVMRIIPVDILPLEKLKLPKAVEDLTEIARGMILVTGVTGSGKSTTLAAIIDRINNTRSEHIITVEDPVEFVHPDKKCLINQRGVGEDTHSFADALKAALREDPDIILVGEMRDMETIEIGLHAANTGHLVFSTLHTLDAKETIDRIIGTFGAEEQPRIRLALASVLEGVLSQRLIPSIDGGRVAGLEILKKTARIEQLIMEDRDNEIPDALAEGKEIYGTQTFDQSLLDHYNNDKITKEMALDYATNPSDMKLKMQGVGKGATIKEGEEDKEVEVFEFKPDEEEA
ncbi:MAG: PilT/PilU family type 4a pilus ATPase [Campylobacterota bacterium]|nr:PilT/PilU family type 4a pilus ATPase [Campylobacterota bacterium]